MTKVLRPNFRREQYAWDNYEAKLEQDMRKDKVKKSAGLMLLLITVVGFIAVIPWVMMSMINIKYVY